MIAEKDVERFLTAWARKKSNWFALTGAFWEEREGVLAIKRRPGGHSEFRDRDLAERDALVKFGDSLIYWFFYHWGNSSATQIKFYPQAASGRWDDDFWYLSGASDGSFAGCVFTRRPEQNGVIDVGWFDLFSRFGDPKLKAAMYEAGGYQPRPGFERENRDHINGSSVLVPGRDGMRLAIPAPPEDPNATPECFGAGAWLARHVIETALDPAIASTLDVLENLDRYPRLKRVHDASTGLLKDLFFRRLMQERYQARLFSAFEIGWPVALEAQLDAREDEETAALVAELGLEEDHNIPVHEIAPGDLARRLFNAPDGAPGWIQRFTGAPAVIDQAAGRAPVL